MAKKSADPRRSLFSSSVKRGRYSAGRVSLTMSGQSPVVYMGFAKRPNWNAAWRSTASASSVELLLHGVPLQDIQRTLGGERGI